ncbi:hypothetical protein ES702_06456 [subsurface metagenome]
MTIAKKQNVKKRPIRYDSTPEMSGTQRRPAKEKSKKRIRIIEVYDYLDEVRKFLYQVVKYGPKELLTKDDPKCRFRRPNPDNPPDLDNRADPNHPKDNRLHWIWNLEDTRRVLYRLPEILDSVNIASGKPLFICEGEPDVESLRKIGSLATTNPMGALSWRDEFSKFLTDYRSIVILPDNDKAGKDRTEIILKSLQSLPYPGIPEIRIIELPGLAEGGDVTDWLNGDGSKKKLLTLVKDRLPIRPDSETETKLPIGTFLATDFYNTDCFAKKYSDRMNYCRELGWLFYDRKRWNRDTGQITAIKFAMQTARDLYILLKTSRSEEEHSAIFKHFLRSQTDRKMKAMIFLARSNDKILVPLEDLDVDPYLLNCDNGTIDLHTGQFHNHRPGDNLTKLAPVIYDPEAHCELWLKCLGEWMQGDIDKIEYLQRLMGICLTGDICARCFPIFHGSGFNGKSVFVDTIRLLMGDYGWEAPQGLLAEKQNQSHPTEIASLAGKRLVTVSETKANMMLRTSLVKQMTGDQTMSARFMRQDLFSFKITHKTILSTQNRPRITETANAIWERVHLVPWSYRIPDKDQNPHLTEQLKSEWSGILNWLLEGCRKWQKEGFLLKPPDSIKTATQEYRESSDILADFVAEKVRLNMPQESTVRVTELYKLYIKYNKNLGIEHPISQRNFNEYFKTKDVRYGQKWIDRKNVKVWFGMGLQDELPI